MPTSIHDAVVKISHALSGSTASVNLTGATVTSFIPGGGREVLFVSSLAKTDGSKAIRGGIPLAFPQFGRPDQTMPQHGFLRVNRWTVGAQNDGDGASSCEFTLDTSDAPKARGGDWSVGGKHACVVTLTVSVGGDTLTTVLSVTNRSDHPIPNTQALFHTYYSVAGDSLDPRGCRVEGLGGYTVRDQIVPENAGTGGDAVIVDKEVDRIYSPPTETPDLDLTVVTGPEEPCADEPFEVGRWGSAVRVRASAEVSGAGKVPVACVVWNPHVKKSKGMADFGDEEYHNMLCVEPGVLNNVPDIPPGVEGGLVFTQIITALGPSGSP
eukprot:CAMPEP_0194317644 /NCGR_PEP_ID=MMETSP0171-20130528/14383_1 /TAXON_ID=218684 /ORGANISM="Corethron pennatum, Strain L29A3" /LENGTH=324 /DNA_ID=CAMNT_0039074327 /DNA_START=65 /DNA_END=1039 /DNA_ORIENTATION=+